MAAMMQLQSAVSERRPGNALANKILDKITVVADEADEVELLARITRTASPLVISFINQNVMNLAWRSPDYAACLIDSDILFRDGIGIELCLAALGRQAGRNMNGTDFTPRLAAAFSGRRTAIFGTEEPWISRAADALAGLGCQIVAKMDGFKPEADYVGETMRMLPDLIILAMGNPKQEIVARIIAASVRSPVVIVNGGAVADFLAGRFERAPLWVRRARLEWAFRLLQEPRRLWRRYLLGGVSFAWHLMRLRMAP
jgi:exopolysaccharide biosynthesis WecB/TagA/CpsF family protein